MADLILSVEYILGRLLAFVRMDALVNGRRRSLIRLIGSALPLKTPPRMRLPQKLRKSFGGSLLKRNVDIDDCYSLQCDVSTSVNASLPKPDVVMDIHEASSDLTHERFHQQEKILSLEQQVTKLQSLVNQILMQQQNAVPNESAMIQANIEPVCRTPISSLPPPPPPPPPPLPPQFTCPISQLGLNISKSKANSAQTGRKHLMKNQARPSMGEVLKDLNKIKLRHVERSPGGRPIRLPASPKTPDSGLTAVLKRRFAAIQTDICETDSDDSSNSFRSRKEEASH